MKKILTWLLVIVMSLALLAGCGNVGGLEGNSGLTEEQMAFLEEAGFPMEEFEQLPPEEQAAILAELGYAAQEEEQRQEAEQTKPKRPTVSDVEAGGSYVVTIGDSLLWNYFELYYVDGELVKIVEHFQKSGDEPEEISVYEGEEVKTYSFNFVNFCTDGLQAVIDMLTGDYGYSSVYIEPYNP